MQGQNRFSVVIFLVVVLAILHSSKALNCYGTTDDGGYQEMQCPPNFPECVKFSSEYVGDNIHACAIDNFCEVAKDELQLTECYECKTDLCNA